MLPRIVVVGFCLGLLACTGYATDADYEVVTCVFPTGDADHGRQVFAEMGCASCHRVAGETELPEPVSDSPGPDLGPAQARQGGGLIATSIIAPSHQIPDEVRLRTEDGGTPMGDYTETMTVRQLTDLVAYIQSRAKG